MKLIKWTHDKVQPTLQVLVGQDIFHTHKDDWLWEAMAGGPGVPILPPQLPSLTPFHSFFLSTIIYLVPSVVPDTILIEVNFC